MKHSLFRHALLLSVLTVACQTAVASERTSFVEKGFFVSLSGGYAWLPSTYNTYFSINARTNNSSSIIGLAAGYQANRFLGAQIGATFYPGASDSITSLLTAYDRMDSLYGFDLLAKLNLPLGQRFYIDLGVGPALMCASFTSAVPGVSKLSEWYVTGKIVPGFGLRLGPQINLFGNVSWTINSRSSVDKPDTPAILAATLGISYLFQ